ncbi:hypothetical protein [Streptomyces sp. AV19]|uniref:hypothetical protein n=1 Tax=Streptomyces sp. AV19 TaxID=2793068 RepID=UPI002413A2B4|nr:hypothetical protein [Streptomyces sp. AV19]MDG4536651.1 hypothetical protein [Streptomyces sp. AV19]
MRSGGRGRRGSGRVLALVGAGLVMAVCCAVPLLAAGGALGVVGGVLREWWLVAVGVVVVCCGAVTCLPRCRARRRRGPGPEECRPSGPGPSDAAGHGKPPDPGEDDAPGPRGLP